MICKLWFERRGMMLFSIMLWWGGRSLWKKLRCFCGDGCWADLTFRYVCFTSGVGAWKSVFCGKCDGYFWLWSWRCLAGCVCAVASVGFGAAGVAVCFVLLLRVCLVLCCSYCFSVLELLLGFVVAAGVWSAAWALLLCSLALAAVLVCLLVFRWFLVLVCLCHFRFWSSF